MRNVKRVAKPQSLIKNASRWKRELLAELKKANKPADVPERFYNRYKKADIRDALIEMYGEFCCYCESRISDVSFEQIEHRYPKRMSLSKFPEKTFSWDNLHLSCEKCNNSKLNQFDEVNPILDAVIDVPISDHLSYIAKPDGVYCCPITERGETTVDHANLDRLKNRRLEIYVEIVETIKPILRLPDGPKRRMALRFLRNKCSGEHGSLFRWSLKEFNL